jgi:ABC-type Zn2+ transport system substrate-binding protein/surface adhesin
MTIKRASAFLLTLFCVTMIMCGTGCQQTASKSGAKENELPKLKFHKPHNFRLAVERLREIHDLIVAEEELPAAITYTVVEVRHAHADGESHVHYNLVKDEDHDHDEHEEGHEHHGDHEHEEAFDEETKEHIVHVEIFTELTDIVRWLPGIASDSDMAAVDWKLVDATSDELTSKLEPITGAGAVKTQREKFRNSADEISAAITKLEAIVKPNAAKVL